MRPVISTREREKQQIAETIELSKRRKLMPYREDVWRLQTLYLLTVSQWNESELNEKKNTLHQQQQ